MLGTVRWPRRASCSAQIAAAEYATRRAALAARVDWGVVIAFGGREPVKHWPPFYQLPSFRYLTGFLESDAAFVMVKRSGKASSTLFVTGPNPRVALYNGDRATPAEVAQKSASTARFVDEMPAYVDSLVASGLGVYSVGDFQSGEYSASDWVSPGWLFARDRGREFPGAGARDQQVGRRASGEEERCRSRA